MSTAVAVRMPIAAPSDAPPLLGKRAASDDVEANAAAKRPATTTTQADAIRKRVEELRHAAAPQALKLARAAQRAFEKLQRAEETMHAVLLAEFGAGYDAVAEARFFAPNGSLADQQMDEVSPLELPGLEDAVRLAAVVAEAAHAAL